MKSNNLKKINLQQLEIFRGSGNQISFCYYIATVKQMGGRINVKAKRKRAKLLLFSIYNCFFYSHE